METRQGRIANTLLFPIILAVFAVVLNFFVEGQMLTGSNISILITNCVTNTFVAWGISYIWSSGPDFSSAASLILGALVGGILTVNFGLSYLGLFGGSILTCVLLQLFSTFIRLKLNLPVWVVGLAMCLIYESFGIIYSTSVAANGRETVTLSPTMCKEIIQMPWIFILLAVGLIVMIVIQTKTSFGSNYAAVSCNPKVAAYMGIKVNRTIYIGVGIGAVMLGIAGALIMIYSTRIAPPSSLGSFGTISKGLCAWLLSSGMDKRLNSQVAILLSAVFIAIIFNFLTRIGIPQGTWLDFILGIFIMFFLCLSAKGTKEAVV